MGIIRTNWLRNTHSFEKKKNRKFDLMWPGVDLTLLCCLLVWGQIANWLRFFYSTSKSDHKSYVKFPKNNFWFWWPSVIWRLPYPYLVWPLCSQGIFTNILWSFWLSFGQELSTLGFVIQKRQNLAYDLTLTRDLRSILKS